MMFLAALPAFLALSSSMVIHSPDTKTCELAYLKCQDVAVELQDRVHWYHTNLPCP
jgi:hypothetical protein